MRQLLWVLLTIIAIPSANGAEGLFDPTTFPFPKAIPPASVSQATVKIDMGVAFDMGVFDMSKQTTTAFIRKLVEKAKYDHLKIASSNNLLPIVSCVTTDIVADSLLCLFLLQINRNNDQQIFSFLDLLAHLLHNQGGPIPNLATDINTNALHSTHRRHHFYCHNQC